jgi:hypothetical protein
MKIFLQLIVLMSELFISNTVSAQERLDNNGFTKEYSIAIPKGYVVFLYEEPAKPGEHPGSELFSLERGDKVKANLATRLSEVANDCRRKTEEGQLVVYKWIYTKDWLCVKVTSSASSLNVDKIGWLNKMFVEPIK